MINVADTYNSLALGNFHAIWSRKLRPRLWSDGLEAAEEPPAWKRFRLKWCSLNHLSLARHTGEMDVAAIASHASVEMLLTFFLKIIITQKYFSFPVYRVCHESLWVSRIIHVARCYRDLHREWFPSTVGLIASIWFVELYESRDKRRQHMKEKKNT